MKTILIVSVVIIGIVGIIATQFVSGLANKTITPERIIDNYEWFYDQYNQIQSMQSNATTLQESINTFQGEEKARKQTELQGLKMVLNNSIAEYNSKSRQITRKMWKSESLPYQMEMVK